MRCLVNKLILLGHSDDTNLFCLEVPEVCEVYVVFATRMSISSSARTTHAAFPVAEIPWKGVGCIPAEGNARWLSIVFGLVFANLSGKPMCQRLECDFYHGAED